MMLLSKLAWRSIWRNRRRTIITTTSISLGLMLAVFFISFAEGIYAKMTDDAVRMLGGHITIEHPSYRDAPAIDLTIDGMSTLRSRIEHLPGVERTKILVMGQGVIKSGSGALGVMVIGVEPSIEKQTSPLAEKVVAGSYLHAGDRNKVYIGRELAKQLRLGKKGQAQKLAIWLEPLFDALHLSTDWLVEEFDLRLALNKKLVLTTTNVHGDLVEELLRVKGIFKLGTPEMDGSMIQIPIETARKIYGLKDNQATQLGVILKDAGLEAATLSRLKTEIREPKLSVHSWRQIMPELASYIKIDGGSNFIFQGILLFLIMFTIFNTILMSVLERKREFAVLLALGTPPSKLKIQIMLETAMLGCLGCMLGLILGGALSWWIAGVGLDMSSLMEEGLSVSGFGIDPIVYPEVTVGLLGWLGGVVFTAIILIGLYPMSKVNTISLSELLR